MLKNKINDCPACGSDNINGNIRMETEYEDLDFARSLTCDNCGLESPISKDKDVIHNWNSIYLDNNIPKTGVFQKCPFCGSDNIDIEDYQIFCGECGLATPDHFSTVKETILFWNRMRIRPKCYYDIYGKEK